mgnify:CR=1 FL=1
MVKINSRNKGASFERDKVKRNLEQYQEKDLGDLNIPNHTIECKRYHTGNWYRDVWWEQVINACGETIPVLIWKYNHQPRNSTE